jgi:ankyrin repeat protein
MAYCNSIKFTPLHSATHVNLKTQNYYDITKLLIEHDADVNAKGGVSAWGGFDLNDTPLHFAADNGNYEIVKLLVEHGADVNAKNWQDYTPLHNAVMKNNLEVVQYLISKGSNINAISKEKEFSTPLFLSVGLEFIDMIKLLIRNSADIHLKNGMNETPLDLAERLNKKYAIPILWPYYHPDEPYKSKPRPSRGFPPFWNK